MQLVGCATTSVFSPYPEQMKPIRKQMNATGYNAAIKTLSAKLDSSDRDLYGMELGRIQQLAGDYQGSIKTFNQVINDVQNQQLAAKIRASNVLAQTGSMMTNDNSLPYRVKDYELIFLFNYQVLNYLAIGDIQDALVSIRQSDQQQQWYVQEHLYELQQAQAISAQNNWSFNPLRYGVTKDTYSLAQQVTDPMQNEFAYYLSGIIYEATGDYNDAFISMQNAYNLDPNNSMIRNKLLNVLQEKGNGSQLQYYLKKFGLRAAPNIPANNGQVVVIYEQGLVPPMHEADFPIVFQGVAQTFTFPVYKAAQNPLSYLTISTINNNQVNSIGNTQKLVNVQALAAKSLVQNYPIIFIREALRIASQGVILNPNQGKNSNVNQNLITVLAASVYSQIMAGADLRSWLTLPNNIQALQAYLPSANISLILDQGGMKQTVPVTINANRTTIVWVVDANKNLQVKIINL
jgi:hypothetical protein